jgi:hypothetical protein
MPGWKAGVFRWRATSLRRSRTKQRATAVLVAQRKNKTQVRAPPAGQQSRRTTVNSEWWDRWLAKGYAHDAGVRYRVRAAAVAIGSLIALGLAIALTVR